MYLILGIVLIVCAIMYLRRIGMLNLPNFSNGNPSSIPFTIDLTQRASEGVIDPVIGREEEINRVLHILSRRTKNNPLLVGPAGVGKTAIAEGLAWVIATDDVPTHLQNKKVLSLQLTELLSGTKYRGEFEERVHRLVKALEHADRSIILFIDEIHMLVQTTGTEGALNVTDIFKPALARGDLQVIGATSLKEYEKYIQPDETLERRFQVVLVDEPTMHEAIEMLKGVRSQYENFHNVTITDGAIDAAVRLSHEYIKNRRLPDKAIDLVDEASAAVKVEMDNEHHAVHAILHHAARSTRYAHDKKSSKKNNLTRPHVTPQDIKKVVSEWTKVPMTQLQ